MRLVGGRNKTEGRVEIYHDGQWGRVCSTEWNASDAEVVCSQLGYLTGIRVIPMSEMFGSGSGVVWLDGVHCQGNERYLRDCPNSGWGDHSCSRDATVICQGEICICHIFVYYSNWQF